MNCPTARVPSAGYDGSRHHDELFEGLRNNLARVIKLGEKYGVKPLLELHGGNIIPSASATRRVVDGFDPERVGVIFDPGNQVREGMENWKMGLEILGDYLALVHVKNCGWFREEKEGKEQWVCKQLPLEQGIADWGEIVQGLKAVSYQGYLSLEDFTNRPVEEKLEAAAKYLRPLL